MPVWFHFAIFKKIRNFFLLLRSGLAPKCTLVDWIRDWQGRLPSLQSALYNHDPGNLAGYLYVMDLPPFHGVLFLVLQISNTSCRSYVPVEPSKLWDPHYGWFICQMAVLPSNGPSVEVRCDTGSTENQKVRGRWNQWEREDEYLHQHRREEEIKRDACRFLCNGREEWRR